MKLTETTEFQESEEDLIGEPVLSFQFVTKNEEEGELVERQYEFCYAKEWDTWTISHYTERRAEADKIEPRRNWRTAEDVGWGSLDASDADVSIPQEIIDKLDDMVDADVLKVQEP